MEDLSGVYTKPPVQLEIVRKGQMTKAQLDHFFTEGYVILHDFIDKDLLEKIKLELESSVDNLAGRLLSAGKITNTHPDKDLFSRCIHLNKEFPGKIIIQYIKLLLA